MQNRPYPYCEATAIKDLKEMLAVKARTHKKETAFLYPLESGELRKTYRDLQADVNALGTWMYHHKIRGKHVALVGENSYEWLVAFLASVNGGNVAVAIDRNLPEEEIVQLAKKADVDVAFVSAAAKKCGRRVARKSYVLDRFDEFLREGRQCLKRGEEEFLRYEIKGDDTAAILFTSGTSGFSKGVELTNDNLAFEITRTSMLFDPQGGVLAVLPFHHAFGLVVGILMVINYGQPVYINKSLRRLREDMERFRPRTMFMVPAFVESFHRQIWAEISKKKMTHPIRGLMKSTDLILKSGVDVRKFAYGAIQKVFGGNLSYIICGGAPLDPMYVREFRSWGIEILNGYGATECSPCTAVNRAQYHRDGTVGVPVPGIEVKITEEGEVAFRGGLVMKGYYKDEEATKEVLIDGWYHTGDLGMIDGDGFITLTGRKKNLIILSNGENVSPEELEMNLTRDSAVKEALVYEEDGRIVAEVYPDEKRKGDAAYFEKLRNRVNKDRPPYKRIAQITLADHEFVKNTSMKILRHKNVPAAGKKTRAADEEKTETAAR
ncbi:MAG: AMP-binding protein [Clostridia bacterium]|nr:AMP-binding protein [Clostridia bacterium]